MKVLVACEESQSVCKAFREKGHEAYSCDIIECSGGHPEWHIMQDVLPLLNGNCEFKTTDGTAHKIKGKWDLIIAHPPCTFLTNAGARWLYAGGELNQERYNKGLKAKEFFMNFINADCDKIAVENPIPSACFELPKYTQIIQPYEHGHPCTKKTCLWLKGLPELLPSELCQPIKGKKFLQKNGNWRYSCWEMEQKGGKERARERSKTFPGIAKAMADQWG
ncbi:MAG: DNA cytosine methyltransferase [Clostridia bacterium]|nr:DNA cytosine methyltransferase [Clostridia bacterium]